MALTGGSDSPRERPDLVAYWSVPLLDGAHTVEFEHGTTTGRRVLRVDGKEILRREWMFSLVGDEKFVLGKQQAKCVLRVDSLPFFAFSYSLLVDGKSLEKFTEKQAQTNRSWSAVAGGKRYRIVLDKQTLDVWINGQYIETENMFVDDGTEMRFEFEGITGAIKACSTNKKEGVIHQLYVNDNYVDEDSLA